MFEILSEFIIYNEFRSEIAMIPNPELEKKITVTKSFVSEICEEDSRIEAYASWKIAKINKDEFVHPLHLGSIQNSENQRGI